jgi:amino acid permease
VLTFRALWRWQLGKRDYEGLVERVYGRAGLYVVLTSMLVFAFGAMLAYLVLVVDCLHEVTLMC